MRGEGPSMETTGIKKMVLLLAAALAVALLGLAPLMGMEEEPSGGWVAKVNGEPISRRLFERRLIRGRAAAYQHFGRKYGAGDSADFWTKSFDGEVPLEWLKQRVLDDCVRIKVEQTLARDKGVISDISYAGFLEALERENERRRKRLASGEPVYGPQQYREDEYFVYVFSNMVIELKRRLGRAELEASEEAVRQHYEKVKQKLYNRGDRVRMWAVEIPFLWGAEESGLSRAEAKAKAEEAKRRLDESAQFEEVAREFNEGGASRELVLDDETARFDDRQRPRLKEEALKLCPGETSDAFEERGAFYIVKCMERDSLGFRSFEEVRDNVRSSYVDEQYEALIAELVGEAGVEVNPEVYQEIRVR